MLSPGETVTATAIKHCGYGVLFTHGEDEILVLLPELSWTLEDTWKAPDAMGQQAPVLVSHSVTNTKGRQYYVGSIRDCVPNPYLAFMAAHQVNDEFDAVVVRPGVERCAVEFSGLIARLDLKPTRGPVQLGEAIRARVVELKSPSFAGLLLAEV